MSLDYANTCKNNGKKRKRKGKKEKERGEEKERKATYIAVIAYGFVKILERLFINFSAKM